jgi:hypothetical protein
MTNATLKKHMGLWATELNQCRKIFRKVLLGTVMRHRTGILQFLKENTVDGLNIVDELHEIIRRYLELFALDLK